MHCSESAKNTNKERRKKGKRKKGENIQYEWHEQLLEEGNGFKLPFVSFFQEVETPQMFDKSQNKANTQNAVETSITL